MMLTSRTEYALRLLMLLALQAGDGAPVPVPEAARRLGLSAHHLAKVAQDLRALDLVEATRGRSGGLRLAASARTRTLGTIVRELEPLSLAECFDPSSNTCVLMPACRLAGILKEAGQAFFDALDAYTLDDLVMRPSRLRRLLVV